MYREAKKVLERGLSRGAGITLGVLAALIGAGMAAMAPSSAAPSDFYLFSAFCGAIAVACLFTGVVRRVAGRLLGAAVFAASAWYFVVELSGGQIISGRSGPSLLNAAILLLVAGFPGLAYALFGRFTWRKKNGSPGEP